MPPMVLYRILGVTDIILGSRAAAGAIFAIDAGLIGSTNDLGVWFKVSRRRFPGED